LIGMPSPASILHQINRHWHRRIFSNPIMRKFIDPTFGYETIGSAYTTPADVIRGTVHTCPESGVGQSMTAYLAFSSGVHFKCALYKDSDKSFVATTEELTGDGTTRWVTFNFPSPKPNLQNIDYILCVWSDTGGQIYRDFDTNVSREQSITYDDWPDPLDPVIGDAIYSIYCTYTIPVVAGAKAMYGGLYLVFPA